MLVGREKCLSQFPTHLKVTPLNGLFCLSNSTKHKDIQFAIIQIITKLKSESFCLINDLKIIRTAVE